jgi:hypothetical protein
LNSIPTDELRERVSAKLRVYLNMKMKCLSCNLPALLKNDLDEVIGWIKVKLDKDYIIEKHEPYLNFKMSEKKFNQLFIQKEKVTNSE